MQALTYQAQLTEGVEVRLALFSYIEGGVHVIYSPALDLYGYGNDEGEARNSFDLTLEEYIAFTTQEHTLADDLGRLGWFLDEKEHTVTMPSWMNQLQENAQLNDIMLNKPFKKFDQPTRLPAFA